jgi:hypothetical protein
MSTPNMPFPHTHAAEGEDIVTFHAERTVTSVRHHLINEHGIDAVALPVGQVLQRHAEAHAVLLTAAQQAEIADRDKRSYMAGNLRRIAQIRLETEVEHASLPMPYDQDPIEIVALEEVRDWLLGLATRIENGADL